MIIQCFEATYNPWRYNVYNFSHFPKQSIMFQFGLHQARYLRLFITGRKDLESKRILESFYFEPLSHLNMSHLLIQFKILAVAIDGVGS